MSKINRYTKAMRQLRSPLKESVPTNSMQGIYVDTPFVVEPQAEILIQGAQADYTQDDPASNGADTSGLFDAEGNQLTGVPPETVNSPDNSYILGPMATMWYSWGNFSTIGYIRESDRRMVNLASITGPLHTWDKTSGFSSYGQLTLEQAVWFVDNKKYGDVDNNYANANYRAYYPGPPSSATDAFGRYLCTITGVPKDPDVKYQPPDKFTPGTNVSGDDEKSPLRNIVPGSANPKNKDGSIDWDKVSKGVETALTIADIGLTVASIIGILIPEPATSAAGAAGLASLISKFRLAGKLGQGAKAAKGLGLARGLKGFKVGATGLKAGGFKAVAKGGAKHTGSKGILSAVGNKMVYSAPNVGKVGKSALRPGTGAARYTKFASNPFAKASKTNISPGGVTGSIVPGGARGTGPIGKIMKLVEPQHAVTPKQFQKGSKLFKKVMGGNYKNSKTANKIRKMAKEAGFNPGQANIKVKNIPMMNAYEYEYGFIVYLSESVSSEQDAMVAKLMENPKFVERLPEIVAEMEVELELSELYAFINDGLDDQGEQPQEEFYYAPETRKLLREIKQPYIMPEEKKVKLTGYKPKLPNKDKMRQIADSMTVPERVTFAKAETGTWKAGELQKGARSSQAKKNEVLELLGQGNDSWVYMTETSRKKAGKSMYENFTLMNEQGVGTYKINRKEPLRSDYVLFLEYQDGTKSTMLQSELNEKMSDQSEKWRKDWKEPIKYEDQPAYKKVKKILSREIPLKDIQPEFPKKAPPKLDPETQMHPDMFKRHDYFTKLDPESAKSMAAAPTGDSEIDSEVEKAKKKQK